MEKVLAPGVGDGGVEVGQGNSMTMRDEVVRADESSAEAVRDDGGCVITSVGNMFDGLYLHVTVVADGCSRPGGLKVVLPFGADKFAP